MWGVGELRAEPGVWGWASLCCCVTSGLALSLSGPGLPPHLPRITFVICNGERALTQSG